MTKRLLIAIICISLLVAAYVTQPPREYGVFLGINEDGMKKLDPYKLVVIEPSEFSEAKIKALHAAGKTVFGYLNIGSVEEYRPYFHRFQEYTIGTYEDWPDERWVDVSASEWQSFIVDELGKQYAAMGFDGLFLDNTDVYYYRQSDDIFEGLCTMLRGLKQYGIKLIINGGDLFVSRCIEEETARSLFDGINQETVFTSIDFDNQSYGIQPEEETAYFKEYLSQIKDCGLSVYLLEYGASQELSKIIDGYCSENGFLWYNAEGLELR